MTETLSLSNLLSLIQGEIISNKKELDFEGVAPLNLATPNTISFFTNEKYLEEARKSKAGAILCPLKAIEFLKENHNSIIIACENPYASFAKVSQFFFKPRHNFIGISEHAFIDKTANIASSSTIFPNVFIGPGAQIGERTVVYPGSFIGAGSTIGEDCILYPNVVVREGCTVGNRCVFNPGSVIGGDGFGFAPTATENVKIPQIGGVEIADDVEIGSNSTIDRGALVNTKIAKQTKIDNLVMIAHNVEIGEMSLIAAQTGISGSTKIGKKVILGGQVGIVGHIQIGDNVTVGAKSAVTKSLPQGTSWNGAPIKTIKESLQFNAVLNKIVKQYLEKKI